MKKKLTTLIKELKDDAQELHFEEMEFTEALALCKDKFHDSCFTGKGKNTWVSEDCQEQIKDALRIPEIAPKLLQGEVVRLANNPSYVYCKVSDRDVVVPVVVPKRMQKSLLHKKIKVQLIKDDTGETFRYDRPRIHPD